MAARDGTSPSDKKETTKGSARRRPMKCNNLAASSFFWGRDRGKIMREEAEIINRKKSLYKKLPAAGLRVMDWIITGYDSWLNTSVVRAGPWTSTWIRFWPLGAIVSWIVANRKALP
jgi:hypothetical protein